jgi:hypothetical protein
MVLSQEFHLQDAAALAIRVRLWAPTICGRVTDAVLVETHAMVGLNQQDFGFNIAGCTMTLRAAFVVLGSYIHHIT